MIILKIYHDSIQELRGYNLFKGIFILVIFVLLLLSCQSQDNSKSEQLETQKKQWVINMNKAFPDKTKDTTELQRRLEYFKNTGNKVGQLMMYYYLGNEARATSQLRLAIENHTKGLQIAFDLNDTINITAIMSTLATNFRRIGAINEAAPYYYQALQIAENYRGTDTFNIERNMASAYNGIGNICRAMQEYDEAIRIYQKALKLEKKNNNYRGMAINYANIGSIHFDKKEYDKAEEYYIISLKYNEKANLAKGIALCCINIGMIYKIRNELDKALHQFMTAYNVLSETKDRWYWLDACFHIANIYILEGNYNTANKYLKKGLETALEINSIKHLMEAYELFSIYNYELGNFKQSVENIRLSQQYRETLQHNKENDRLLESRVKYETDKFTKKIEELDQINREQIIKRKISMSLSIPVIFVLIGLLLLLYYKRKLEKRQADEFRNLEKVRSNFFTNMTHEFRTPITVINGLSEHLRSTIKNKNSSEAKDLEAISRQGRQLRHLVNQLLDFSRSEAGESKPKWRHGDIVEYLTVICEPYTQYARKKGIELFIYSEVDLLLMNYVPSYVKTVIGNMLSNALKHCKSGDKIFIHLKYEPKNKQCYILIKDSGEGISAKDLPYIFELYYTTDSEKSKGLGSGIGLALSKQFIEEIGGTIIVNSTLGKGTEFTIRVPVSNAPIPEADREQIEEEGCELELLSENESDFVTKIENGKKTILIIEDSKDVAHYISTILSKKYSLIHASNGNEGLLMSEQHIPDLIITDVMMPERDGYSFTKELRASLAISHIPVIMITARDTTEDKLKGLNVGVDAYLTKPFNEHELLVRIKKLLDSRAMLMETYSKVMFQESRIENKDKNCDIAFISKLSLKVNDHLCDQDYFPLGLTEDMCLSESQLNRKIKALTGHIISSFVMRARLNKAKKMLSKRDKNITEVALDCGFSDLSYFSRSFKKVFGYTPSQFIKIPEQQDNK